MHTRAPQVSEHQGQSPDQARFDRLAPRGQSVPVLLTRLPAPWLSPFDDRERTEHAGPVSGHDHDVDPV